MRTGLLVAVIAGTLSVVWAIRLRGQTAPAQAPPATVTTAAISGVVKNGATGKPIPGVIVLLRFGTGNGLPPALARIRRQLTDALGRFVFRDLPGVTGYAVTTTRIGFVDGAYGQVTAFGPSGTIDLKDGQWFDRADVLMWKPGAISGRVSDERGDALVGIPVRVLAQQLVSGTPRLLAGPSTKTDDRGEYRIAGLVPGRYMVVVPSVQSTVPADMPRSALASASESRPQDALERQLMFGGLIGTAPRVDAALDLDPANRLIVGNFPTPPSVNGRPQSYPMTFFPNATTSATASLIDLSLAEERHGADIALQPLPAARVAGTVDGPRDQTSGMMLRLMPPGLEDLANGSEVATTIVGPDGRFVFLNVPIGTYTIDTRRATTELTMDSAGSGTSLPATPGAPNGSGQSGSVPSGPPGTGYSTRDGGTVDRYWTRTTLSVSGDIANVVVPLHPSVTLNGRMVFEGTTRTTVEQQVQGGGRVGGTPAPTVTSGVNARPFRLPVVYAEPASADTSLGVPRSVNNPDPSAIDAFTLEGLRGGEYVLRVNQGLNTYMVKSITLGGQDVSYRPIDLSSSHGGDLVITFTDQMITVNGFVQGDPASVANAAVIAFPVERDQWAKYGFTPKRLQATPSDPVAGFRLRGLPAGEYFFVAVDRALITAWQDPKFLERAAGVAKRVKLEWGDTQSVNIPFARIR